MGKVASSPLEKGETSIAVRARGPSEPLESFANDRFFSTLERGEIIRLGLQVFRDREKSQKPAAPKNMGPLFQPSAE